MYRKFKSGIIILLHNSSLLFSMIVDECLVIDQKKFFANRPFFLNI